VSLTKPKELGGGGFNHIRVGDFLRYRNDPKSRETENTDNISKHQQGQATDILEINTAHCTKKSLLKSKGMSPFPVKVVWQGGGPPNPSLSTLGSFDAVARANAFRDILGALPGESYNGAVQGFEDLLQQLQRRVVAQEIGLDTGSLDLIVNNDFLATLGQVALNHSLGYAPSALTGSSSDEKLRSIPVSYLEKALLVPPTSLQGDDWNKSFERLGRMVVAYQLDIDPQDVLSGKTDKIAASPYLKQFRALNEAFRFPAGALDGIKSNKADAFRKIAAQIIADRLNYDLEETDQLISQAGNGNVKQLSLARFGEISTFPGPILPLIAPADGSSKAKGEAYLAKFIMDSTSKATMESLPGEIQTPLKSAMPIYRNPKSRQDITQVVASLPADKSRAMYREIGSRYMEQVFDLPEDSFSQAIKKYNEPTFNQFISILERRLVAQDSSKAGVKNLGQLFIDNELRDALADSYHVAPSGPTSFTVDEMYDLLLGKPSLASTRAGASWIEEDLGLVPNTFTIFFSPGPKDKPYTPEDKLAYAGVSLLGGEIFDAFDITYPGSFFTNGENVRLAIGQAHVETILGLKPGSFRDSIQVIQQENKDRYAHIFNKPDDIDINLGLAPGTIDKLKNGQTTPKAIVLAITNDAFLEPLNDDNFQNRFGWDSEYQIDGDHINRTIHSKDGTDKTQGSGGGKKIILHDLLELLGTYNTDYTLGYDPKTIQKWLSAPTTGEQNKFFMQEGAKLYSDRLGIIGKKGSEEREALLKSYTEASGSHKSYVVSELGKILRTNKNNLTEEIGEAAKTLASSEIGDLIDQIKQTKASNAAEQAALDSALKILEDAKDKLVQADTQESASNGGLGGRVIGENPSATPPPASEVVLETIKNDIKRALDQLGTTSLNTTKESIDAVIGDMEGEITKLQDAIKTQLEQSKISITIPEEDIQSFINGHMKLALSVLAAASQAKQVLIDVEDTYKLLRTIIAGWSSDKEFEKALVKDITGRYSQVLKEYGAVKTIKGIGDALDRADIIPNKEFDRLIYGMLNPDGTFNEGDTPYKDESFKQKISDGFLTNKEARNNFYYGILDYKAKKNDPNLPKDFSKTIMEGSNKDRSEMLYTYLATKIDKEILATLPEDLRKKVTDYVKNKGTLESDPVFNDWANGVLSLVMRRNDSALPENIGQILREGSDSDRQAAAFTYVKAKLGNNLPPELQRFKVFIDNYDPATGKVNNPAFNKNEEESSINQRYLNLDQTVTQLVNAEFARQLQKIDTFLSNTTVQTLLSGSGEERKTLAFNFIQGKLTESIASFLPKEIKDIAKQYLQIDEATGKIRFNKQLASQLVSQEGFAIWAGTILGNFIGSKLPKGVMNLALDYINGNFEPNILTIQASQKIADLLEDFINLGKDKIIGLVGRALGVSYGQIKAYYDKYKQAKSVYNSLKAGKIDTLGAILALDGLLLDGALTKLVGSLDNLFNLPSGTSQYLILAIITGNPLYWGLAVYSLLFGFRIKCPDLQKIAQKNVKELISSIIDLGQYDRSLVPSQIITYNQSYITELIDKIKKNYKHCLGDGEARCGVFARPEYAKQVHIGF
jgi:hypothetical protein